MQIERFLKSSYLCQLFLDFSTDFNHYNCTIAPITNYKESFWKEECESTIEYNRHFHVASLFEIQISSQMNGSD